MSLTCFWFKKNYYRLQLLPLGVVMKRVSKRVERYYKDAIKMKCYQELRQSKLQNRNGLLLLLLTVGCSVDTVYVISQFT